MSFLRSLYDAFFGPTNVFLGSLPMWLAKVSFIALLLLPLVWVLRLEKDFIYLGSPDRARWRDLRIWAAVVTVPYVLIYLFL